MSGLRCRRAIAELLKNSNIRHRKSLKMRHFNSTFSPENSAFSTSANPPLKILIVSASLSETGGQAVQAKRLLDAFAGEPEVEVGFLPTNPGFSGFLNLLKRVKYVRTLITSLKFLWLLLRTVPRYDIVQAFSASHTSYVISTLPPLGIAKLFRKKIILNYHSGEAEDHIRRWAWLVLPTFRLFDSIVVPSEFLVDVFAKFGFRATAIHNFVDGEKFAFVRRNRLKPVFLSNRNLTEHYNVGCILRAFAGIQKQYPEASLFVAGDGHQRPELETLAADLRLTNVEFLGAVSQDRICELFSRVDVYLNSSNVDNMPLSIIEAFSCGVPVVTTDAGGIPYIVKPEETGLMVKRDDHQALAREAMRLLQDGNLAPKLIENARKSSLAHYSWASVREKWIHLYAELGSGKKNRVLTVVGVISYHFNGFNLW
jgi:glycosyltransferase involved in cell wall biosynthesis